MERRVRLPLWLRPCDARGRGRQGSSVYLPSTPTCRIHLPAPHTCGGRACDSPPGCLGLWCRRHLRCISPEVVPGRIVRSHSGRHTALRWHRKRHCHSGAWNRPYRVPIRGPWQRTSALMGPPNKGMKRQSLSVLELCSLSPVFDGHVGVAIGGTPMGSLRRVAPELPVQDLQTALDYKPAGAYPRCSADNRGQEGQRMTKNGLVVFAVLLAGGTAFGADLASIPVGSRVRVSSPTLSSGAVVGVLAGVEADAVVLTPRAGDQPLRVVFGAGTKLELSVGRRAQWARGGMMGAAIGAVPGLLLTFGDYSSDVHGDGPSPAAVAAMGAVGGALVGSAIGWAIKRDEWREVNLPTAGVGLVPWRGGVAVAVHISWGANRRR